MLLSPSSQNSFSAAIVPSRVRHCSLTSRPSSRNRYRDYRGRASPAIMVVIAFSGKRIRNARPPCGTHQRTVHLYTPNTLSRTLHLVYVHCWMHFFLLPIFLCFCIFATFLLYHTRIFTFICNIWAFLLLYTSIFWYFYMHIYFCDLYKIYKFQIINWLSYYFITVLMPQKVLTDKKKLHCKINAFIAPL